MPYGNFYVGKEGFLYKKNNAIGARRNFSLGAICNQPTDIYNKYVSGSGVSGAVSSTNYAIRRKMIRNASKCSQNNCSLNYFYLGYPLGGNANSGANIPTGPGTPNITLITRTFIPSTNTSDLNTTWDAPASLSGSVTYLITGGGGAGGGAYDTGAAGGGGGGEVETGTFTATPGNTYTLIVGGGGTAPTPTYGPGNYEFNGNPGNDSSISGDITTITAVGGEGGNKSRSAPTGSGVGGIGFISPSTASTGGNGAGNTSIGNSGGGGGGSSGNGGSGTGSDTGGSGGAGTTSSLSGSSVTYGEGGDGARRNLFTYSLNGTAGTIGTSNGGGGAVSNVGSNRYGGDGGSGIIILQYYA